MLDDIAQAVLAREEVVKYLRGGDGEQRRAGPRADLTGISKSCARRSGTASIARCSIRSIRSFARSNASTKTCTTSSPPRAATASSTPRIIESHTDYLVEPLVLDDNGIRPPLIAAGINLFGGPLGLIHRHVTGAIPIRRNIKDPAYLITLKAYVAEMLKKHDLFFYPEGGRSYSGELKAAKTGLIHAALTADCPNLVIMPTAISYDLVLEDHILARATRQEDAAAVHARAGGDGPLCGRLPVARVRHVRRADCRPASDAAVAHATCSS